VIGHRTAEKNGYIALQLGAGSRKVKNVSKAMRGNFAAAKVEPKRKIVEFRVPADALIPVGAELMADHFVVGQSSTHRHIDRQPRLHEQSAAPRSRRISTAAHGST